MSEKQKQSQTVQPKLKDLPTELVELKNKLASVELPAELLERAQRQIVSLQRLQDSPHYYSSLDGTIRYFDWILALPWQKATEDNLDLKNAEEVLASTHHGLQPIKERILEYMAILILRQKILMTDSSEKKEEIEKALRERGAGTSPVILFVGLPGVGKTSISRSIALALGREFIRIPMGGMGSAAHLRGEPRSESGAEPGLIIKGLRQAGSNNPVILLDEIDRVAESVQADIMGVLLELLDPQQNWRFMDYYINYPFDLSNVMFICSANKTGGVSNAVLDRMEIIRMPGYSDQEKIVIARDYLFPEALNLTGLSKNDVVIKDDVWPHIIRALGFDAGIRTTRRTIEAIARKCAKQRVLGTEDQFVITLDNLRDYTPEAASFR